MLCTDEKMQYKTRYMKTFSLIVFSGLQVSEVTIELDYSPDQSCLL